MRSGMMIVVLALLLTAALALSTCGHGNGGSGDMPLEKCVLASTCSSELGAYLGIGDACNYLNLVGRLAAAGQGSGAKLGKAILDCIKAAGDCDAVEACVKASESEAAVCAGAGGNDRCSGNVMVECGNYPDETPDAFDCADAGLICAQGDYDANCGLATCNPATDQPYCEGNLLVECDEGSGVLVSQDCAHYLGFHCGIDSCQTRAGGVCGTDPEGGINCVGTGDACDEDVFTNRCDGSVMVTCNRGKESRVDCKIAHPDLTCRINSNHGAVECQPEKSECLMSGDDSCDAGVVTTCLMGEITKVDCSKYGHTGCAIAQTDEKTIAYCVP